MNPEITIIIEGGSLDESQVQAALESIPEMQVTPVGPGRGPVSGLIKAFEFAAEFGGVTSKVADALIGQAQNQLAGASVKVKIGEIEVEVGNLKRGQIMEVLDKAAEISRLSSGL